MSNVEYGEVDEILWELYLQDCRALETTPTLSDYGVWRSDQGYDEDEI